MPKASNMNDTNNDLVNQGVQNKDINDPNGEQE